MLEISWSYFSCPNYFNWTLVKKEVKRTAIFGFILKRSWWDNILMFWSWKDNSVTIFLVRTSFCFPSDWNKSGGWPPLQYYTTWDRLSTHILLFLNSDHLINVFLSAYLLLFCTMYCIYLYSIIMLGRDNLITWYWLL